MSFDYGFEMRVNKLDLGCLLNACSDRPGGFKKGVQRNFGLEMPAGDLKIG